jgi:hypothetical protein
MSATPEDEMAGTMPFAGLTNAVAAAMKHWNTQHRAFIIQAFFNGDCC